MVTAMEGSGSVQDQVDSKSIAIFHQGCSPFWEILQPTPPQYWRSSIHKTHSQKTKRSELVSGNMPLHWFFSISEKEIFIRTQSLGRFVMLRNVVNAVY